MAKKYDWGDGRKVHSKPKSGGVPSDDLAILGGQNAVTYGPQINQVRDLLNQADEQYKSDIESAKSNATSARMYAEAAIPKVISLFAKSSENAQGSANTVNELIKPTGENADVFRNALAREQGNVRDRITESGAAAQTEFRDRAVGAESGKQFAVAQAAKARDKTRDTLTQRLADILQEQGATSAATLAGLRSDRSTAETKAQTEQDKLDQKAADKREKHLETVKTATGDYKNLVADATADWRRIADQTSKPKPQVVYKPKLDDQGQPIPGSQQRVVVTDKNGRPVMTPGRKRTPAEIKQAMLAVKDEEGHQKYTPGDVHVMLLVSQGKALDPEAIKYLKNLRARGVRIPRAWIGGSSPATRTQQADPHATGGTPDRAPGGAHGHI